MVPTERSFPRGGTVHQESKPTNNDSNIIFGATQKKIRKAPKTKDKQPDEFGLDEISNGEQLEAFSAETLTFDTIQEEMLVMGVVRETSPTSLQVALPGRLSARVLVADVSDAYARVVKSAMNGDTSEYHNLTELFHVGQVIYGKAIKTDQLETKRVTLILSLRPSDVHSQLQHTSIKKGFIFSGAIAEIQEHGYIIETGIQGLQAFVSNEDTEVQQEKQFHVGQLTFLKVKKITHDKNQSTCTCEILSEQNKLKIKSQNETNLDYILPGSIVRFKVSKHLKDGLKGTIMNENFAAYINEHHLAQPLHTLPDYELNEEYNARVLYTMPLTKLVYLTLNLNIKSAPEQLEPEGDVDVEEDQDQLKKGSIVEKAKVLRLASGGVILLLEKKFKGLISYGSIRSHFKGNYDKDEVLSKYGRKTKHKVRVLGYDVIESLYYCSDDPNVVNEKLYTLEDLQPGELVSARLIKQDIKINGGWNVKLGKINGIIDGLFLAGGQRYEVGQQLRCRVLEINVDRRTCYLTNRPEYLSKNAKLLTKLQNVTERQVFTGTVVKSEINFILVKFCNGIKGVLYKQQLKDQMSISEGETMKFRILKRQKDQLVLSLPEDKFQLGEICPIEITNCLDSGLQFKINYGQDMGDEEDFLGLIPIRLLSDHTELLHAQKRIYPVGTQTEAACITQNIFSVRDVPYFSEHETKTWQTVKEGDILRSYVKNVSDQIIDVQVPVRNYNKLVKLHVKMLRLNAVRDASVELVPEQLLYVKVLSKEPETKTLTLSAKLTDVWSGKLSDTAQTVESYLQEVAQIRASLKELFSAPIAKYVMGEKISVIFKGIDATSNDWLYTVDGSPKLTALLVASLAPSGHANVPAKGSKHQAVVLWIDYASDVLLISNKRVDIDHITTSTELPQNLVGKAGMKAKVLLKLESVAICSLKRKGVNPLVICPIRLHSNDVENSASSGLRQGDFCNIGFIHDNLPIAVPENVWKLWRGVGVGVVAGVKRLPEQTTPLVSVKNKKPKLEKATTKGPLFFEDRKAAKRLEPSQEAVVAPPRLPGVSNFWNENGATSSVALDSSSSDEDVETEEQDQKKRRLSSKAKAKAQVKEEQRLREIEERNANPEARPETVDQYERLVLAQPNNSLTWLQYIAFLLSNTEIEKARTLARRAIATISFREPQELRNIWSALLNIELTYNSHNFDDVLKEALNSNDPLEIYLSLVDILRKNNQKERLSGVLVTILNKFKSELKVWSLAADAYFWLGRSDQVHALLQRALRTLPNSDHINCIVAFAKLFAKHSDHDMAQTLLDDVVTSYPKRTDIWMVYVDMLIKAQLIEAARNVLERAVVQKLKPHKMQVIYKKYLQLEETFGSEATVAKVKQQAEQWVRNYAKSAGAQVN